MKKLSVHRKPIFKSFYRRDNCLSPCFCHLLLIILFPVFSFSQNPLPAAAKQESIMFINGTAHLGNGKIIENAAIGMKNGKFDLIADTAVAATTYNTVTDIKGKHIYPGFIAANTILGLNEYEGVRATRDYNETGNLNPSVRSAIAYNTDSKVIPTVRSNGVLLAQIVPQGSLITGSSSVMELDGWNWEDALYKADIGIHINWPQLAQKRDGKESPEDEDKKNADKKIQEMYDLFRDAAAYSLLKEHAETNVHLEAMRGLFNGTKKVFVHANSARQIVYAVNFFKEFRIGMVLVGGMDAWLVTDLLKEQNIPVILERVHALPSRQDDDVDLPYKLPFLLKKAGILFCNSVEGFWQVRNLAFNAGTDAAYGLTKEEALEAITLSPAKILGIDKTTGSLETGKDATFIISSGDALDMKSSNIEYAYIRGRQIDLDNLHRQLYGKYMFKYGFNK